MHPIHTPEHRCPYCNYVSRDKTCHVPKAGDFTVCIECAHLIVFDAELKARKPTTEERAITERIPRVFEIQLMIKRRNARSGKIVVLPEHAA